MLQSASKIRSRESSSDCYLQIWVNIILQLSPFIQWNVESWIRSTKTSLVSFDGQGWSQSGSSLGCRVSVVRWADWNPCLQSVRNLIEIKVQNSERLRKPNNRCIGQLSDEEHNTKIDCYGTELWETISRGVSGYIWRRTIFSILMLPATHNCIINMRLPFNVSNL